MGLRAVEAIEAPAAGRVKKPFPFFSSPPALALPPLWALPVSVHARRPSVPSTYLEAVMAKRFFYVSMGIFLLALTYHVGSRNAVGQVAGSIGAGGQDGQGGPAAALLVGSALYVGTWNSGNPQRRGPIALPKPCRRRRGSYRSGLSSARHRRPRGR